MAAALTTTLLPVPAPAWCNGLLNPSSCRSPARAARCRRSLARRCCGQRGPALLATVAELCCERSNPAVQVLFLALLGSCLWAYCRFIFPLLPLPGIPSWHK